MSQEQLTKDDAEKIIRTALLTIAPDADLATLKPQENLRRALELDSMDFLAFIERVSAVSGRRIEESEYPRMATLESGVDFLSNEIPEQN